MERIRFFVNIEQVKGDYRPISWPIKHPYWCSGESENDFILISYIDSKNDLIKLWPEARIDSVEICEEYSFTDRFPKPDWFQE